tara:strand:+ start:334 stop:489 length:156 start_codon:yes stop_codon:yes gene_type:complete
MVNRPALDQAVEKLIRKIILIGHFNKSSHFSPNAFLIDDIILLDIFKTTAM